MNQRKRLLNLNKENYVHSVKCMFHAFAREQVYPGQPAILGIIAERGSCTQSELAKCMGVSSASVAVSLKRMERSGMIARSMDEADMRVKRITLTERGRQVLTNAIAAEEKMSDYCLRGFSEEELAQMERWLRRINDNLKEYCGLLQQEEADGKQEG